MSARIRLYRYPCRVNPRPARLSPWAGLFGFCLAALVLHLALGGSVPLTFGQIWSALSAGPNSLSDDLANTVVWQIRLPRGLAGMLVGMALGAAGGALQVTLRNPLAEPYVLGVSGGAAAVGTFGILVGWSGLVLMGLATLGGVGALVLVLVLVGRQSAGRTERLLVAGVVIGALLSALTTLNLSLAGQDSGRILAWLLGSLANIEWSRVGVLAALALACTAGLLALGRPMDVMALGDDIAHTSGLATARYRQRVLLLAALATAAAVGTAGIIGFLGLVGPHLAALTLGGRARTRILGGALYGGALLVLADLLAQRIRPGLEVPVGIVTALLGAPALLWVMRRAQS